MRRIPPIRIKTKEVYIDRISNNSIAPGHREGGPCGRDPRGLGGRQAGGSAGSNGGHLKYERDCSIATFAGTAYQFSMCGGCV